MQYHDHKKKKITVINPPSWDQSVIINKDSSKKIISIFMINIAGIHYDTLVPFLANSKQFNES